MLWMLTITNIKDYSCSILTDKSSRRKTKTTNEIKDMENLKFAYHYLNFAGDYSSVLPDNVQFKIRFELANGFGQLDQDDPNLQDKVWDWSHVRDSSDEALDRIAGAIRSHVLGF